MNLLQTTLKALSAAAFLGLLAVGVQAATQSVEERVKPIGDLCMAGEACASATIAAAATGEPRGGEQVYNTGCAACHGTGAAGAPKLGDAAAWAERLTKGKDVLYVNAYKGINAMPAKGLCADCSEEEINAAVDHILVQSGQ